MLKCERCGEDAQDFLVKHHICKGKTITLCGNCHIKEHKEHPHVNYKEGVVLKGHVIEREVSTPVSILSDNIVFGYNTNGTLSIVAKTFKKDFMLNLNGDNIKKLKTFLDKIV